MLRYQDARTSNIVDRLVAIGNTIRMFSIVLWTVVLGVVFSATAAFIDVNIWWVGAIIGILFGLIVGIYIASLATVIFEWAAQILIAQGEIISLLKRK